MKRLLSAAATFLVLAAVAQAHFLWIVPTGPTQAKVIFSDKLEADDPALLDKVTQTKLFGHDKSGKHHDLKFQKTADGLVFEHPKDVGIVCGSCDYGVFKRGSDPAMRLKYYFLLARGEGEAPCWDCMPLQVCQEKPGVFTVQHDAKPLADAEVLLQGPKGFEKQNKKTDGEGKVVFDLATAPAGVYGLRVGHTLKEAGEVGGKKFEQTKLYTTLVFEKEKAAEAAQGVADEPKADAEATRLLADARAARLLWTRFPGFTANVEVNLNGKVHKGTAAVTEKGKVTLADLPEDAAKWAKQILGSAVSHRIGGGSEETPCAFADDDKDHPLGRLINVLNDEMHSSYRIKDRQIMVVNRDMGGTKFSIVMQENRILDNGQYLPASYTVCTWEPKTGALARCESHTQTWQRVGAFELPKMLRVATTAKETTVNSLTLSDVKLTGGK